MKRAVIEKTLPPKNRKGGKIGIVQLVEDILVLNIYTGKQLEGRYCINTKTFEYEFCRMPKNEKESATWSKSKLRVMLGGEWYYSSMWEGNISVSSEDNQIILDNINLKDKENGWWRKGKPEKYDGIRTIGTAEDLYYQEITEKRYKSKMERQQILMDSVPDIPDDFPDWIMKTAAGDIDFLFYKKESKTYSCSNCGETFPEVLLMQNKKTPKNGNIIKCPNCGRILKVKKIGKASVNIRTTAALIQKTSQEGCVVRHFDVEFEYQYIFKKRVKLSEGIRVFPSTGAAMQRNITKGNAPCKIYYNAYCRDYSMTSGLPLIGDFYEGNIANRKMGCEYLYPGEMKEALEGTAYESWSSVFEMLAAGGQKADYNRLMALWGQPEVIRMVEYLFKNRFYRLLSETSERISLWFYKYDGLLSPAGETIEEVFGIKDRQKINRIRDMDGGECIASWMIWSDMEQQKIPQETLEYLDESQISVYDMGKILKYMSLHKAVNYLLKQKKVSYPKKELRAIAGQYDDYISMCEKLKKDTKDEMIYKPTSLIKRHEEATEQIRKEQEIREKLLAKNFEKQYEKELKEKYPLVEPVLKEIKSKLEYKNDKYCIIVPQKIIEIYQEGHELHHCVGSTERYYDRIASHETYICFMRDVNSPEKPYYTIEVEPGGTIRQHRSAFDAEPDLDKVKEFLKEWQQVIRKRMDEKDKTRSKVSEQKRYLNIKDLQEKRNTRVLQGLEEDFMEAMA